MVNLKISTEIMCKSPSDGNDVLGKILPGVQPCVLHQPKSVPWDVVNFWRLRSDWLDKWNLWADYRQFARKQQSESPQSGDLRRIWSRILQGPEWQRRAQINKLFFILVKRSNNRESECLVVLTQLPASWWSSQFHCSKPQLLTHGLLFSHVGHSCQQSASDVFYSLHVT